MKIIAGRRGVLRTFALTMATGAIGLASAGPKPVVAAVESALTPPGATRLDALKKRLAQAPRRRDFKTVPMILRQSRAMGSRSVDRSALVQACAQAGMGQHRHRRSLAELDAQHAQYTDLVIQTSGFPRCFGYAWYGGSCALRSGHLGQVSAHQIGRREVQDQYADHRAEGGGCRSCEL